MESVETSEYELLDFGLGRKLERFGQWILDRPSPAAEGHSKQRPEWWSKANLRFTIESQHQGNWWVPENENQRPTLRGAAIPVGFRDKENSNWRLLKSADDFQWRCRLPFGTFQLKCTPFGHVGLFPEHFQLWQSIVKRLDVKSFVPIDPEAFRVLSLFAYTGASTICFAKQRAQVTHVEAARNVVQWARLNTELSFNSDDHSIRWLCEDVTTYVRREVKRKSLYTGIILDPPTYGHGPKGQVWKIQQHLPPLLEQLALITSPKLKFVLLTAHSTDYDSTALRQLFKRHFLSKLDLKVAGKINSGINHLPRTKVNASRGPDPRGPDPRGPDQKGLDAGVQLLWLAE